MIPVSLYPLTALRHPELEKFELTHPTIVTAGPIQARRVSLFARLLGLASASKVPAIRSSVPATAAVNR